MVVLFTTTHYSLHARPELTPDLAIGLTTHEQRSNPAREGVFESILQESAREAFRSALGDTILGILTSREMLENLGDPQEFTERLQSVFGASGAKTLQFIVAKELYRQVNLSFDPDGSFDYAMFVKSAREAFLARRSRND